MTPLTSTLTFAVVVFVLAFGIIQLFGSHRHSWGSWESKDVPIVTVFQGVKYNGVRYVQERRCATCGKYQREELR